MTEPPKGAPAPQHRFTVAEVARMFDLPEAKLRYWSQTGFIVPTVREAGRRFYGFTDLVSVKVAKELLEDGHPLQRVRRSLDALRDHTPNGSPLSRFRIRSQDDRIVVDGAEGRFEPATGQLLLDFDPQNLRDRVAEVTSLPWVGSDADMDAQVVSLNGSAYDSFLEGAAAEEAWEDASASDGVRSMDHPEFLRAQEAYERAVEMDPEFAAAWTNLGGIWARAGELDAARDCFDEALRCDPDQPEARCNLAELALRAEEFELAIEGFRGVLRVDPEHLEAHYGLARALLRVGGRAQARAHLERFCSAVSRMNDATRSPELDARRAQAESVLRSLRRER